ncbi:MAG: hypothetical protein ABIG44_10830 [Planctomycetota bacterium]
MIVTDDSSNEPQGVADKCPANTAKDDIQRSSSTAQRWLARPPRLWQITALVIICAFVAHARSFPGGLKQLLFTGSIPWLFFGLCVIWPGGILLLGGDYIARMIACVHNRCFRARDWRWYVAGLLIIATIVAWQTDGLLRWRFSANRAALEGTAARLLQSATLAPAFEDCDLEWPYAAFQLYGQQVGDYHVREVAVFPDERAVFLDTGGFFRSGWGFLYDPDGQVTVTPMELSVLGDGWFTFEYAKE